VSDKLSVTQFKGIKNDNNPKQTGFEWFKDIVNFNFETTSTMGLEKVLCPRQNIQIEKPSDQYDLKEIDGIYEYRFLDLNNILRTKIIVVCNGNIYEVKLNNNITITDNTIRLQNLKLIYSGINKGKCSFATYQDKLFIANGKDNIFVYYGSYDTISQMAAPLALKGQNNGFLTGTYKYQMTYVTAGGEEILGSVSNAITVTNQSVKLEIPLGYEGVTSRKIYRTKDNGNTFYLVQTVNDNTTMEVYDNLIDSFLTEQIGVVNNELPKPYFLSVAGNKLFGGKVDKFPTQVFVTDTFGEVFDGASFIDVSNFGNDNTPVEAVAEDFNKIVVGTGKNIFFINPNDNSVVLTRANIGVLDGYSLAKCPSFNNFTGGLMFVSTEYDVRLMSGMQALPVSTSLDNVTTVNFAQNIQGTLPSDLKGYGNIASIFYNYKYMLQVDNIRYIFDIRNSAWTKQQIKTESYESTPKVFAIINNLLVNGQYNGWLETEYMDIQYIDEECPAYLESIDINAQTDFTFVEKLYFWFTTNENNKMKIDVTCDGNLAYSEGKKFDMLDGAYNKDFSETDFTRNKYDMDYRVFNIYKPCRFLNYKLTVEEGNIMFENFEISGQQISNKE
jgi:hypothetical protein